jgi:hypothetical protein
MSEIRELMSEAFAAPLGEVIAAVGRGVGEAQAALDAGSLAQTLAMVGTGANEAQKALAAIGYRPTFYVIPETSCEVQVSLRIGGSSAADGSAGGGPVIGRSGSTRSYVTPIDASYANRFGFDAQATAKLSFKIVAVPPPAATEALRVMPDLLGTTGRQALAKMEELGLPVNLVDANGATLTLATNDNRKVRSQVPAAGELTTSANLARLVLG